MGKISTKENKNAYQLVREELGLSREKASELLEGISPESIERIENEQSAPHPDEVKIMAEKYNKPELRNHYCANQCPLGEDHVPEVKVKDLSRLVLEVLSSLNTVQKNKDTLIDIAADGEISSDEIKDFVHIKKELENISMTVDALQLWAEKMVATGAIDKELYEKYLEEYE